MSERLPTDELRAEHEVALRGMGEVVEASALLRSVSSDKAWEAVGARLGRLREGLLLHFRKEEEGLFPEVAAMAAQGAPRVDILGQFFGEQADDDLTAHALLRQRMDEMAAVVVEVVKRRRGGGSEAERLGTLVEATRDLLERHAGKEDRLVFPMIERVLSPEQMAAVRERMEAIRRA